MDVRTRGLKFPDEPISKNPLQVGLTAKQHPEQQDLLNLMSEKVTPNIESVFSETSWGSFGSQSNLHPHLISIIQKNFHFERPTSIQVSAIKHLLDGRDALIKAQTGSGKTVAYALPMIHNLIETEPLISRSDGPKALVILPTRELATQTGLVMTQLCRACVRIVPGCLIGGAKRKGEKASLRKGLNIIVSTPQRLLDHLGKTAALSLKALKWLVIDEADRLVELGFERDVRRIIERVTRETSCECPVQTVLLSATLTPGNLFYIVLSCFFSIQTGVETLAGLALKNPVKCEVAGDANNYSKETTEDRPVAPFSVPSGLRHFLLVVPCKQRLVALVAFLLLKAKYNKRSGKLIVFFATQDCVDFHYRLFSETLCNASDSADGAEFKASDLNLYRLHGSMDHKCKQLWCRNLVLRNSDSAIAPESSYSQIPSHTFLFGRFLSQERQAVFQEFSSCPNGILLTTDVASRGLDLAGVAWVVQYHVSSSPIDYVHRVGRTARAGGRGKALLLLQPEEESYTRMLTATVGLQLQRLNLADVLQTALYHLRHTKARRGVSTVEEAAASMGRYFLLTVNENSELLALAERAYLSFLRAYASFSGPMRDHFVFKRLHLGHVARAFCLRDAPSDIASRVTGKRHRTKSKSHTGVADPTAAGLPIAKRSRHLEFPEEDGEVSSRSAQKRQKKPRPAELATRNMLAEYGL
ncbi:putative ATP-dependent RNA helicase DDX31 [Taenia solium]|eukprot:TsM_000549800 transcript=TsM_000549800 gene=TsM_000549800